MDYGDLIDISSGINYLSIDENQIVVENGYCQLSCYSNGFQGFYENVTYTYCESGYLFTGVFGIDYTGDYSINYYSDGTGYFYSDNLQYVSGTVISDKIFNTILINGCEYINGYNYCISDGTGSFIYINDYCSSGSTISNITGQDGTGNYLNYFYSNGCGGYSEDIQYYSGTFLCSNENYVYLSNGNYQLNGTINYYFDGLGGCYLVYDSCDSDYIFDSNKNCIFISDGNGNYQTAISGQRQVLNKLKINWDIDEISKNKYFNDKIYACGQDITLSLTDNKKSFYEINAICDTNIYVEQICNNAFYNYSDITKPFIFIKNNGCSCLILHTSNDSGNYYSYDMNKYKALTFQQCCSNTINGICYNKFIIKPQEAINYCFNINLNYSGICQPSGFTYNTKIEYPFGFVYNFNNICSINPYGYGTFKDEGESKILTGNYTKINLTDILTQTPQRYCLSDLGDVVWLYYNAHLPVTCDIYFNGAKFEEFVQTANLGLVSGAYIYPDHFQTCAQSELVQGSTLYGSCFLLTGNNDTLAWLTFFGYCFDVSSFFGFPTGACPYLTNCRILATNYTDFINAVGSFFDYHSPEYSGLFNNNTGFADFSICWLDNEPYSYITKASVNQVVTISGGPITVCNLGVNKIITGLRYFNSSICNNWYNSESWFLDSGLSQKSNDLPYSFTDVRICGSNPVVINIDSPLWIEPRTIQSPSQIICFYSNQSGTFTGYLLGNFSENGNFVFNGSTDPDFISECYNSVICCEINFQIKTPTYMYENICDFNFQNEDQKYIRSMNFDSQVDNCANLNISFNEIKQNLNWNLNFDPDNIYCSNVDINYALISDNENHIIVNDFLNENYSTTIAGDKSICILYNIYENECKLKNIIFKRDFNLPSGSDCSTIPFSYGNELCFMGNYCSRTFDLTCNFYENNSGNMYLCTDEFGYIWQRQCFNLFVCDYFNIDLNLNYCDNYLLKDVVSKNMQRCNMYLPTTKDFKKNYCIQLSDQNLIKNTYISGESNFIENYIKSISEDHPLNLSNKSKIYNVNLINSELLLNTNTIQSKDCNSESEEYEIFYNNNDCSFFYCCYEFLYKPASYILFKDKQYKIENKLIPLLISGCCCVDTVQYPSDAIYRGKFKVLTSAEIYSQICSAEINMTFSGLSFNCQFVDKNSINFNIPKITCENLSGYESPNLSIDIQNNIFLKKYIDFYVNPSFNDSNNNLYPLNNFINFAKSKLNGGILSCSLCTGIGYKISDFSQILNQKPAFHVIYDCDICCAYSDFKQGTCTQMYCYTEQTDFKKIYFSGHKLGWPLSLGSSLFCCINTGSCPVTCYITGYKCTMVNTYYGVGMPYYPTGYYSGVCCEALYSYQTGYSSYTISKLANKGCLFNEKIQGPELWGDGFYIPTSTGQISTACGCLLFEGYCFDALNFLCINSPNQYSAINCKILSTNYIDFLNSVISFFNFHSYCSYLNCGVITYGSDLNARSYCYNCSGYTAANSALSSCLTGNYLKNPIVCFAEGSSGSYACCATVLTPFTYIVVCGNTGQYAQGSTEYNSLMMDLQHENIKGFIYSNWTLSDEFLSTEDLDLTVPISYKSLSGKGYNYILPVLCNLSICNKSSNSISGLFCSYIEINDKLNFKESGNLFNGNFASGNYLSNSYFNNNGELLSINIDKNEIADTDYKCININKYYKYTGIQPINIESNYLLSDIRQPIVSNNLTPYSYDANLCKTSGTYYYEYDLNNFNKCPLRFTSPEMTNVYSIKWCVNASEYLLYSTDPSISSGSIQGNVAQIDFDVQSIISNNAYNYLDNCIDNVNYVCVEINGGL